MNTIRVLRANVILDIRPEEKERYMEQGFSVIDMSGKIVEEAISNDVNVLRGQVSILKKELEKKDEEIKDLKSKLAKAKKDNK